MVAYRWPRMATDRCTSYHGHMKYKNRPSERTPGRYNFPLPKESAKKYSNYHSWFKMGHTPNFNEPNHNAMIKEYYNGMCFYCSAVIVISAGETQTKIYPLKTSFLAYKNMLLQNVLRNVFWSQTIISGAYIWPNYELLPTRRVRTVAIKTHGCIHK